MSNAKLAAAIVGGYVLGRTKKGKAAVRLAMWVSGNSGQLTALTKNEQIAALVGQVQGPVLEAVQQAALNTATARMNALSDALGARTEALSQAGDVTAGVGGKVSKGVSGAGKSLTGSLGKLRKGKDQSEQDEQDIDESEDESEDQEDEEPEDDYDEDDYDEDEDEEEEEPPPPPRKAAKKQPAKRAPAKKASR